MAGTVSLVMSPFLISILTPLILTVITNISITDQRSALNTLLKVYLDLQTQFKPGFAGAARVPGRDCLKRRRLKLILE